MATIDDKKYMEYMTRLQIAKGHRQYGIVPQSKNPDDDEGGSGTEGFQPPPGHPLLGPAAQFSGDFKLENPQINENPEAEKELKHRYEAKLDKKMQAEKRFNPTPGTMGPR